MKRFLLAALLATAGFNATAVVIDFNSLTGNNGSVNRGQHYEEDGFQLDTTGANGFRSLHPGSAGYDGNSGFFNNTDRGITTLTKIGGGLFSLDSIDLDSLNGDNQVTVTFIGTLLNNSTTSTSFSPNSPNSLQTFTFGTAFDNVKSVSWSQDPNYHSFDNINVTAQVPEPGTVAMLGLGLLAFTAARRKSARK